MNNLVEDEKSDSTYAYSRETSLPVKDFFGGKMFDDNVLQEFIAIECTESVPGTVVVSKISPHLL